MLESFEIKNFRSFQHIQVERLSRVNLIVGKNNAGKSSFLEAVELYASNASPSVLQALIESRQETWSSRAKGNSQKKLNNPLRHLFLNHKFPSRGEEGISLGEVSSDTKLQIYAAIYQNRKDHEEDIIRKIRLSNSLVDEDLSNIEVFLVAEEGKKTRRLVRLDREIREMRRKAIIDYGIDDIELKYTWQIVSTENMPHKKLAALWDLTSLTDLESEVIEALRLIDSRVSGVAFVEDASNIHLRDNRIPLVKLKGIDEPLPLRTMGDGMTRLFHIIVALVNAKDGLLLIDEFENGLHWSVQPQVWDIVFQLSEKMNVQVFATTHSRDCIKGFDSAWNKYPNLGAFFRLDIKDDLIKVTEYTSETLTDAIEMDVEVR